MGQVEIRQRGYGKSMREAFNREVDKARDEYGHEDGYSGAINCCELEETVTKEYNAAKDKKKFVEDAINERIGKREVWGVCLSEPKGNTNKIKTTVERIVQKGARKFVTMYIARTPDDYTICSEITLDAAIKKARKYCEENQQTVIINIEKQLIKQSNICAQIRYKASTNEKPGIYYFFGNAPD